MYLTWIPGGVHLGPSGRTSDVDDMWRLTASKVGDETRASEMFGDPWGVWVCTYRYAPPRFEAFKSWKKWWRFITGLEKLGETVRPSETWKCMAIYRGYTLQLHLKNGPGSKRPTLYDVTGTCFLLASVWLQNDLPFKGKWHDFQVDNGWWL